jgi:hypothetical protein
MARKDIYKSGVENRFSKDNQPKNRGRRPSVLARYIKENEVSITDIKLMIGSLLFAHNSQDISALLKDKECPPPIGISLIMGALVDDIKKHNIDNLMKIMDRAFGKPKESIDFKGNMTISPEALENLDRIFRQRKNSDEEPGGGDE